jgi:hypothetical protein
MPTRDDIIADWHSRLAEASQTSVEPSSSPAWLVRLRVRLYQFLISLYGDGDWQATCGPSTKHDPSAAVDQADEPTDWQGKPAKDLTAIRAVLKTVAQAGSSQIIPGSFAEGTGPDAWVAVATLNGGIHPLRCASLLKASQITVRWLNRSDDVTIEVRAKDETNAAKIIQANINRLRRFNRFVVPSRPLFGVGVGAAAHRLTFWLDKWSFSLITIFHFALVIPLAVAWAAIMSGFKSEYNDLNLRDDLFQESYWLALRCLLILATVLTWLRLHWLTRDPEADHSKPRQSS